MILGVVQAVAGLASTWMEGKVETQKAKVAVAKKVLCWRNGMEPDYGRGFCVKLEG